MKRPFIVTLVAAVVLALLVYIPDASAQQHNKRNNSPPSAGKAPSAHSRHVGYQARSLPAGYRKLTIAGKKYFYHGGVFYRSHNSGYVVINAPIGARITGLPMGYVSFSIGPRRYYYFNATYYVYEPKTQEYVVVEEPDGGVQALTDANEAEPLFVYPSEGQSEEQVRRDRYECYVWASEQSGFDPAEPDQPSEFKPNYDRALSACLSGRGYTVR